MNCWRMEQYAGTVLYLALRLGTQRLNQTALNVRIGWRREKTLYVSCHESPAPCGAAVDDALTSMHWHPLPKDNLMEQIDNVLNNLCP